MLGLPPGPVRHLKLAQLPRQIHESDGDDLRLPLKTQRGAQTVIHEGPGHLYHVGQLLLVTFEALGVLEQVGVRVFHDEVKFDGLQQDPLESHDLLPRVGAKLCPGDLVHEALGSLHDVLTLLGRLLNLARQEEAAARRHMSGEGLEGVHHVEAVEVDDAGGHGLVAQAHLVADLQDEARPLPPVLNLLLHTHALRDAGRVPQLTFLVVPPGPLGHGGGVLMR